MKVIITKITRFVHLIVIHLFIIYIFFPFIYAVGLTCRAFFIIKHLFIFYVKTTRILKKKIKKVLRQPSKK